MQIPISSIVIGERQRDPKDLDDLSDLDSMAELGQLQAIGVRNLATMPPSYELIWGRRRLAKATALGWKTIEAVDRGHVPELLKQEIELVEDIGRKERSWQDRCRSVAKLYNMKRREKKAIGEVWTVRMMAAFTSESKSNVGRMLQVGEALAKDPEGPIAKAGTYVDAVKEIYKQAEREVTAELQARREAAAPPISDAVVITEEGSNGELVPQGDTTEIENEVIVTLRGMTELPDDDSLNKFFYGAIGYNTPAGYIMQVIETIRPDSYAVFWYDSFETFRGIRLSALECGIDVMPYPLVWNKIKAGQASWPFSDNVSFGLVIRTGKTPELSEAKSSAVSVIRFDGDPMLHHHVVDLSLARMPENMPVLVIGYEANAEAVAVLGRTPVFFEPDEVKYAKIVTELTEHYKNTIPGVIIR